MERDSEEFIGLLTANQTPIYACILTLLPDRAAAQDVLQETNLTLWRKAGEFEAGTNFLAWAGRIARYHVLNHRRKLKRDRLVFEESLFLELAERQAQRVEDYGALHASLRHCIEKLPAPQRRLVERRYALDGSVQRIAEQDGKSVGAISQSLYRIRELLLNCVQSHAAEGHV